MTERVDKGSAAQRRTVLLTTIFVVFVCVSLLVVDVWLALRARTQEVQQATMANTNLARAVSQQMDSMFSEVGNILTNLVYELERHEVDATLIDRLQPVLVNHVSVTEHIHDLFVYDAKGGWLVTSQAAIPASANNSDRDYFIHHRDNASTAARIGKPIISRSSGVWVIPISKRFNDADGNFAGVVLATITVDYLKQVISEFEIGQNGALGLFLKDGTILVRRPFNAADMGKNTAGTDLYALMTQKRFGTGEITSPFDGVERLASYRHMRDHPMIVAVAASKQEMLQQWRATTFLQTGWIVLLCGFIGTAGGYLVRSVRGRLAVELSLGRTRDELTDANTELARLARHDSLTGLANRRYFDEVLPEAFAEARRSKRPLALVMIDVDYFKRYNDVYGHPEGDRCLHKVAQAVMSAARRPRDFVARYGGEEMVIVLPDTDAEGAVFVAEAARAMVSGLRLPHAGSPTRTVSISAGVAVYLTEEHFFDAQGLLQLADIALYEAKATGRNRVFTSPNRL